MEGEEVADSGSGNCGRSLADGEEDGEEGGPLLLSAEGRVDKVGGLLEVEAAVATAEGGKNGGAAAEFILELASTLKQQY